MSTRRHLSCLVAVVCFTAASGSLTSVSAVPIPVSGPVAGSGDGLKARWVNTDFRPHSVSDTLAALALGSGDMGYVGEVNEVVSYIDYSDGCPGCAGFSPATTRLDPLSAMGDDD